MLLLNSYTAEAFFGSPKGVMWSGSGALQHAGTNGRSRARDFLRV